MHILLQGARGYSASKAASDSAHSPDSAVTSCRRLISFSLEVIAVCGKGRLLPKNFRGPLPVWMFGRVEEDDPGPPGES